MVSDRDNGDVVHALDFDGTIHVPKEGRYGDIGKNSADHDESGLLGYKDVEEFNQKVNQIRNEEEDVSRGSEHAHLLAEGSEIGISEINRILTESQSESDVDEAYRAMCDEIYSNENFIYVTTAGIKQGAEAALNGSNPEIIGAELEEENGEIRIERYNGRNEKKENLIKKLESEDLNDPTVIAAGDSKTDEELMKYALETGGEAIAVSKGSAEYSSVKATDGNYTGAAIVEVIFDTLYTTGDIEKAERQANEFVDEKNLNLPEVEPGPERNKNTLIGLSIYERIKNNLTENEEVSSKLERSYV